MIEEMVPMVVMTGMFAMIFGIVYIRSRENMAMIEKGLNPRNIKATPKPFISLKYGLLMIGVGLGLISAYFIDHNTSHQAILPNGGVYYKNDNPAIYFALIAIGGGLGLVISYVIEKKHLIDKRTEE